ncbi:pilin [Paraherbaspirillum soli]|uniref:Prepilin-type N-terminal cleavage/methylation domain-containing protein n=1 Tax=Paraherbaspirillum soli TaxID=631222 RepID=A0ABW0M7I1_9BURK
MKRNPRYCTARIAHGLTVIETLIVVALIGVLAAVAIPQYQNYVSRTKWQENIVALEPIKLAIVMCAKNNAGNLAMCDSGAKLGIATMPALKYGTVDIAPTTAAINVTGSKEVGSLTLIVTPKTNANSITWVISGTCEQVKCGISPS